MGPMRRRTFLSLVLTAYLPGVGCAARVVAIEGLAELRVKTPVLVIGGWADPGLAARVIPRALREALGGDWPVAAVSPGFTASFERAADVAAAAARKLAGEGPLDVVGVSMGGLVARYAAVRDGDRLNVRRLYTLATPHSGAALADALGVFGTGRDMRTGSAFLAALAARERRAHAPTFPIISYERDRDYTIGDAGLRVPAHLETRTVVVRVPVRPWENGHNVVFDPRILTDVARRVAS